MEFNLGFLNQAVLPSTLQPILLQSNFGLHSFIFNNFNIFSFFANLHFDLLPCFCLYVSCFLVLLIFILACLFIGQLVFGLFCLFCLFVHLSTSQLANVFICVLSICLFVWQSCIVRSAD